MSLKKPVLLTLLLFSLHSGYAQQAYKMKVQANYNDTTLPKVDVTDIWNDLTGWFDPIKNKEYIIAGGTDSIYFFDITTPGEINLVARKPGAARFARNRDYETYKNYAYCVSDQGSGIGALQVFDLSYLPDSVHMVYQSNSLGTFTHTIFIDTVSARLYMSMNTKPGGYSALDIISLQDPENPSFLAELNIPKDNSGFPVFNGVHELFVKNDTAYLSCEGAGLFIFDLRDLQKQKLISTILTYPDKGYNHSSWLDKTGRYLMFTDENIGMDIKIFDLQNFSDPRFVSQFNSNALAMPHNAYWYGDFAYVSAYHDGVRIWNIQDPSNPVQVAWYDTHPVNPEVYSGFKGCWGIYPFLPSKRVIASDLTAGIFVFELDSGLVSNSELTREKAILNLFPNPTHNYLNVSIDGNYPEFTFAIYDLQGKSMLKGSAKINSPIEVETLQTGMYFIELMLNEAPIRKPFVKW